MIIKNRLKYKVFTVCSKGIRMGKRVLVGESNTPYSPVKLDVLRGHLIQDSVEYNNDIKLEIIGLWQ